MDARAEHFEKSLLEQKLIGIGSLLFGSLYLFMVFVAAIVSHALIARNLAIFGAGVSYLAMWAQYHPGTMARETPEILVVGSIAVGLIAGLMLLTGV